MKSILPTIDCPDQIFGDKLACIHGYSCCHVGGWVNSIMIGPWQIGILACYFNSFYWEGYERMNGQWLVTA